MVMGLHDILHVAQSQYHDIGVARRMGYTVCWIERRMGLKGSGGTQEVPELTTPDYHFATLAQLADFAESGKLRMHDAPQETSRLTACRGRLCDKENQSNEELSVTS